MGQEDKDYELSIDQIRETGKYLFYNSEDNPENRKKGLKYLLKAFRMQDDEATYIIAKLMLENNIKLDDAEEQEEMALTFLLDLANKGHLLSRELLNRFCLSKYENLVSKNITVKSNDRLLDFDGKVIKINRKGLLTPVDAQLKCINGENILLLSANIQFFFYDDLINEELFREAVIKGIKEWEGKYSVFGGQNLTVKIELSFEPRLFDYVLVTPLVSSFADVVQKVNNSIDKVELKNNYLEEILQSKRSFATSGKKWSVHSRKFIFIQSDDNSFSNYDEIKEVAKHEFGHVLGLGDLYCCPSDDLSGVEKGTFQELDGYYVNDKIYNLVMCDHHGPISNNDIEMVLLAFRDNKEQLFQVQDVTKDQISKALGRGN